MALLPKVKFKALPTFPAQIYGGTGIEVTKANGSVTVDLDYSEFGTTSVLPTSPHAYTLSYDTLAQNYTLVPMSLLGGGGGSSGIADAPINGTTYGRNSAAWINVPPEANNDGFTYGRSALAWVKIPTFAQLNAQLYDYDTMLQATAATIPSTTNYVRTAGYATVGDRGAALYIKVGSAPSHAGKFQSADGAWWELSVVKAVFLEQFGAKTDGSDCSSAISGAIGYCNTKGAELHLGPYTYTTSLIIGITQGIVIRGSGEQFTKIVSTTTTGDIVLVLANNKIISGVEIHDLIIDRSSAATSGFAIRVTGTVAAGTGCYYCIFSNIYCGANNFSGVSLEVGYYHTLRHVTVARVGPAGMGFQIRGLNGPSVPSNSNPTILTANVIMTECFVHNGNNGSNAGLIIDSWAEGLYIDHCSFEGAGLDYDIWIRNNFNADVGHGAGPQNLFFTDVVCDSSGVSALKIDRVQQVNFSNCWLAGGNVGPQLFSAVSVNFNACMFLSIRQSGITINTGCAFVTINGCTFDGISYASPNTGDAIDIVSGINDITITNNKFSRLGTFHRYSVVIFGSTSQRILLTGNNYYGWQTGNVSSASPSGSPNYTSGNVG